MKNKNVSKKQSKDFLEDYHFFSCPVYKTNKIEFHDELSELAEEYLELTMKNENINPDRLCNMSFNMLDDMRISPFANYITSTAYNILNSQGYDLSFYDIVLTSIWMQDHKTHSSMPEHVHPGTQLVAFYFLEGDEEGSRLVLHDPRPGKVITDLPLLNPVDISHGSPQIFIKSEKGDLIFTNSYVPHSFTTNMSEKNVKFLHINISVVPKQNCDMCVNENTYKPSVNLPEII